MTDQSEQQSLHSEGTVSDYFIIETHLLSTRTAEAYKAIDRARNIPISLWKLRHPLPLNSDAVKRFLARMYDIAHIEPALAELVSYGVGSDGVAYAVLPVLDGQAITSGTVEAAEAERRFTAVLRLSARLHEAGLVCGDLCGSSFWVTRSGDVRFIGVIGSFDAEAAATAMMPPLETIPYLAPEQRGTGNIGPAADVFALGVLGYSLFCKVLPFGTGPQLLTAPLDISKVVPLSDLCPKAPTWVAPMIMRALDPNPEVRFSSASDMLRSIDSLKQRAFEQASVPARVGKAKLVDVPRNKDGVKEYGSPVKPAEVIEGDTQPVIPPVGKKLVLLLGVVFAVAIVAFGAVIIPRKFGKGANQELQAGLEQHRRAVGSTQLQDAIDTIAETSVSIAERAKQIETIVNSDDPLAHDILVKTAREADSPELRELSEKAILDRARRFGLMRSAEQVKQWLRSHHGAELPQNYEAVLQSLDSTLPIEARSAKIRAAYVSEPATILRLAVALALDSGDLQAYQPVLSQLIGDSSKIEDAKKHSSLGLIMAEPTLSIIFGDDIVQRLSEVPDSDVMWLLVRLADRNDPNVRALANAAVQKKILDPVRTAFLEYVSSRMDLPADVSTALIHGASATVGHEDVAALGRWYDIEAPQILLLILATSANKEIAEEGFDILSGKSITDKSTAKLVNWIRTNHFERRAELASALGKIVNINKIPDAEVEAVVASIEPYFKDRELVGILAESESLAVKKTLVGKYPESLGFGRLLNMLDGAPKELKALVIPALKPYNDVAALKLIIDQYEKEKDPDLRQLYKDSFWMIQEREDRVRQ